MKRALAGLSCFTAAASCWLGVMFLVLNRAGYVLGFLMAMLFIAQSAATLTSLAMNNPPRWLRALLALGACGILYSGATMMAAQLSRPPFDPLHPGGPHFEGYALVIGFALTAQGVLTLAMLLFDLLKGSSTPLPSAARS